MNDQPQFFISLEKRHITCTYKTNQLPVFQIPDGAWTIEVDRIPCPQCLDEKGQIIDEYCNYCDGATILNTLKFMRSERKTYDRTKSN
jgi:hypothetical protein